MRIIKRKRNNKEFFYLQHSYRKNNKIITKEKYLGTKIPSSVEKIKKEIEQEEKKELYKKLQKIKANFQKEWKKTPKSAKEKQLEEMAIAFTYNTNAIEGSTITMEETREIIHDKIAPNKPLYEIKETEAHSKVFLNMLNKKEKITNKLILKWHDDIFGETKQDIAGKFREYGVRVGSYMAPDWQDVKSLMNKFIRLSNNKSINPVELAGLAHYEFESIHPFGDGNGRIGRLLINYILWHKQYPMIIIENKKRKSYYKAFKKGSEGFANYFLRRYLSVHKNMIK